MLYLSRKIGESIIINNNIELTVVEVRGKTVKLGFLFPKEATILRKELHQKIMEQNIAAAGVTEAIVCMLAIRDHILPPTINYENPDPDLDLDYVANAARFAPNRGARNEHSSSFFAGVTGNALVPSASAIHPQAASRPSSGL